LPNLIRIFALRHIVRPWRNSRVWDIKKELSRGGRNYQSSKERMFWLSSSDCEKTESGGAIDNLPNLIQVASSVGEQSLQLEPVPGFRQTENNQWAPWLVFKIRTSPAWSAKEFKVAMSAYLPQEVECQAEGWLVPEWWA
jgi:hypothetical protein